MLDLISGIGNVFYSPLYSALHCCPSALRSASTHLQGDVQLASSQHARASCQDCRTEQAQELLPTAELGPSSDW